MKETVARGVENGILAYVGKGKGGSYEPFHFGNSIAPADVEISNEMFVITAEEAKKHDALLRAVRDGTLMPEDWYGPGVEPTETAGRDAPPGSEARIELYTRRAARGEALFSSADYPAAREVDAPAPSQQVSTATVDGMNVSRVHHRAQIMGAA